MIRNPDAPSGDDILKMFSSSENLPTRVGQPTSDADRAAAGAANAELAARTPDKVRAVCVACHQAVPVRQALICECGGFVCPTCAATEEDGVCDHVPLLDPDDVA